MHLAQNLVHKKKWNKLHICVEGFQQVNFERDFDRDDDLFMINVGNDPVFLSWWPQMTFIDIEKTSVLTLFLWGFFHGQKW